MLELNGPGGATNATPGPNHRQTAGGSATMADKASIQIPGHFASAEAVAR
jgi:hypothetical protein